MTGLDALLWALALVVVSAVIAFWILVWGIGK